MASRLRTTALPSGTSLGHLVGVAGVRALFNRCISGGQVWAARRERS